MALSFYRKPLVSRKEILMESRHADLQRALDPCPAEGKPRFQIVKLEERIAPNKGGLPNGGSGGHDCHRDPICK